MGHDERQPLFASIMPRAIPTRHHKKLMDASGLAELVRTAGLVRRTGRRGPHGRTRGDLGHRE
jgi:hypothetical protein